MSRPRPTAVDYVVVALSPALIMSLVGSLAFFLVRVFYQGQHSARLQVILGLFVFAAVLISRISIESGKGRAVLFALPLALATGMAMMRFAEVRGQMAGLSSLINFVLLGIIWWCTHKLTLDCTVLDETQVQSEQGLLQFVGLDGKKENAPTQDPSAPSAIPATDAATGWPLQAWWKRLADPPRKPHTHGVWVVYFSLAALPLFGIGQLFIPSSDASGRRYTFMLLGVYLLSGFGLLITTSLISLRRYLRQRDLQMPAGMVKTWILAGGALVVSVLSVVLLLPRGIGDFGITRPPLFGSRDDLATSEVALGNDGPRHDPAASKVNESLPEKDGSKQVDGKDGEEGRRGEGGASDKNSNSQNGNGDSEKSEKSETASDSGEQQPDNQESSGKSDKRDDASSDSGSNDRTDTGRNAASKRRDETEQSSSAAGSNQTAKSKAAKQIMESVVDGIWNLLKFAFYAVLAGIGLFFAWKYRKELTAAWREFIAELRAIWNRLFGRHDKDRPETNEDSAPSAGAIPRPFSNFQDPFASGAAANLSAEQLVRYTFSALEAWAGEHATAREPQQTPAEFADIVAKRFREIRGEVRDLGSVYSRAAYSPQAIPKEDAMRLAALWRKLCKQPSIVQGAIS